MHCPEPFVEDRPAILREVIHSYPLATLVTAGPSGLMANAVPFILMDDGDTLGAHLVKNHEQVADLRAGTPVLIIFQGPQSYVSPSWYPTKHEHGKAVPTWNYVMVQVHGVPQIIEHEEWLMDQITALTNSQEASQPEPWRVTDAPSSYVKAQLKGIIGLKIAVNRIEGKWKVSQNQPRQNQLGVIAGLTAYGLDAAAELVEKRLKPR